MSSSIALPAGPSATPSCHKGTGSSANSPYSTSPSCSPPSAGRDKALHARRLSFLGSFLSRQECTVINIGEPNSPPWLICYVSSSQGFDWNPEIFLPSCIDCDYVPLENRRDPVDEIFLTDEESKNMLPQ
ncbi:hypothetical protein FOXG_07318 [Fusarium oxysporum f. sp. lycopersici 4287]|uniref:Uncharacterized protein n=2 Tax=Fusarium oxysporum TaxID=5507 RepID=A0A0J9V601_FUSO4|nr:hypothetical protein FOXG_06506 [Fusarium oxysporum f. sp. lycopersici 4287]XP_018244690.1 hypothetical protein FOXG_07318 [Fusarium oxysporum f. sp. lycopersici 4287]KNB04373.1 hypothetical protein FOXG_06506 [Fusarium oxysporum f. sp. lycopersici 4287]KNB06645.1 hypothetical protein FOXG_07318 [Fusarium oxysporum f. sp. lycopersici 4287]